MSLVVVRGRNSDAERAIQLALSHISSLKIKKISKLKLNSNTDVKIAANALDVCILMDYHVWGTMRERR